MKRNIFSVPALILTLTLVLGTTFTGCETESRGDSENDGANLLTEAAILAATGAGISSVTKDGDRYKISGTVIDAHDYSEDFGFIGISLKIMANPDNVLDYFAQVKRYTITIDFPDGSVRPIDTYGSGNDGGFHCYFENIKSTYSTDKVKDGGNWQSVPIEEYNAAKGVGTMVVDRKLADGVNSTTGKNNIGDYQHLMIRLQFASNFEGQPYTFYISNAGVYGKGIDDLYPGEVPTIHANSRLADAVYTVGAAATALRVVPGHQGAPENPINPLDVDSRVHYVYKWYSNTADSAEGGTLMATLHSEYVEYEEGADPPGGWELVIECEPGYNSGQFGNNADHPSGWNEGTKFIPPTDTAGTFHYYVVVEYERRTITSRVVTITVNE